MSQQDTIVAVYAEHIAAEAAVHQIADAGLDMKNFSIVGKGYHTDEKVIGFYSTGDRVRFWGSRGAFWGGLWGLLFGGLMLTIPVVGPVMVLGSLAATVFTAIAGAVEGAVVTGGLGALGAALYSIGIPEHSVVQYETALTADGYLVVGHGTPVEMDKVKSLLETSGPSQVDRHGRAETAAVLAAA